MMNLKQSSMMGSQLNGVPLASRQVAGRRMAMSRRGAVAVRAEKVR